MKLSPFTTVATTQRVPFTSPRSGRRYAITVDAEGRVLRCSCPGYRGHGRCYHAREAQLASWCLLTGMSREHALALAGGARAKGGAA